jgi:hypothetical protein
MNNRLIVVSIFLFIIAACLGFYWHSTQRSELLGSDFSFSAATSATSTVGIYSWTQVLAGDSSRGFAYFCNDNRTSTNNIYLGLGATSSVSAVAGNTGIMIPGNSCYRMTQSEMFYGIIYAIASSATSSLITVSK